MKNLYVTLLLNGSSNHRVKREWETLLYSRWCPQEENEHVALHKSIDYILLWQSWIGRKKNPKSRVFYRILQNNVIQNIIPYIVLFLATKLCLHQPIIVLLIMRNVISISHKNKFYRCGMCSCKKKQCVHVLRIGI